MADPLVDFRGKISLETDCVLKAQSRARGKDKAEIAREILHEWAMQQIHAHNVLDRLLRAEGLAGATGGIPGIDVPAVGKDR